MLNLISRDPDVYGRGPDGAGVEAPRECDTDPLRPGTRSTNSVTEKRPEVVDAGVGRELRRSDSGRGEAERGDHGLDVPEDAPSPDQSAVAEQGGDPNGIELSTIVQLTQRALTTRSTVPPAPL